MLEFEDFIYPKKESVVVREIARAILLDEDNNVVLECVERDDDFGYSKYVETPGGGININESQEEALIREIKEELGYVACVLKKIEVVKDYYNLISRCNMNHYYLAKIVGKCPDHKEELEKKILIGETHLPIEKAIEKMKENEGNVGKLILQRELPILKIVERKMKEGEICLK